MIAIILKQKTSGIYVDAKVIKMVIEKNTDKKCVILTWDQLVREKRTITHKFAIEHLTPDILKFSPRAKLIYIPNMEFLTEWDVKLGKQADVILAKTKQIRDYLNKLYGKSKIVYSKFTSLCAESKAHKDFNMAVHFAGSSFLKGTDLLVDYWLKNGGFLKTNPDLILVITFFRQSKSGMNFWEKLNPQPRTTLKGRPIKCEKVLNIYMVRKKLGDADYAYFREKAGFYICPSLVEGFGHYINEGRCNSSVTITTNAPPMNELIRDPQRVIKVYKTIPSFRYMSWLRYMHKGEAKVSFIEFNDFSQKMLRILSFTPTKLKKIALRDHREFLRDREYFTEVFLKVLR